MGRAANVLPTRGARRRLHDGDSFDKFPDMPIVNTVGLANLELDSEERAPNIVDFAFCIRGAHEGAVYAPSYQKTPVHMRILRLLSPRIQPCMRRRLGGVLGLRNVLRNSSVCPAAHTEKHSDSLPFLLVRELSSDIVVPARDHRS